MNQTTEDSKRWNIIVGGCTTPDETGKITMPPEGKGSVDTTRMVEDTLTGVDTHYIVLEKNDREHETKMENLDGYNKARNDRLTETAEERRNREKNETKQR